MNMHSTALLIACLCLTGCGRPNVDSGTSPARHPGEQTPRDSVANFPEALRGKSIPWIPSPGKSYKWRAPDGSYAVEMRRLKGPGDGCRIWVKKTRRYYRLLDDSQRGLILPVPGHGEVQLVPEATFHEDSYQQVWEVDESLVLLCVLDVPLPAGKAKWSPTRGGVLWLCHVPPYLAEVYVDRESGNPRNLLRFDGHYGKRSPTRGRYLQAVAGPKGSGE